eukprot:TRINITY_DN51836_c0_g1_i1.p1 TRINITY_DN51836_c0_g1~~TRINITY_DN51836_c0_g1_i1.p1  ORF type:complete len:351 (-),score=44.20 TRINITY_DN51836_c0_g1_i1:91-990(-)
MAICLLKICPEALIVVERIVWPQEGLADYVAVPGPLLPELEGRLVLGVHHYSWSGPGRFVPNWSVPSNLKWIVESLRAVGIITQDNYGDLSPSDLRQQVLSEWGFILENDICPVWVSEFGADPNSPFEMNWLREFVGVLESLDADWAYWPLNVGPKPTCKTDEAYGMLSPDWTPKPEGDDRLRLLEALGLPSQKTIETTKPTGTELQRKATAEKDLCALYADKDPLFGFKHVQWKASTLLPTRQRALSDLRRGIGTSPDFSNLGRTNDSMNESLLRLGKKQFHPSDPGLMRQVDPADLV